MATMQLTMGTANLSAFNRQDAIAQRDAKRIGIEAFRWTFYPTILAMAIGLHLVFTQGLAPAQHSLVTGGISLSCLMLFLALERLLPYRAAWNQNRGDLATDAVQTNLILPVVARLNETMLAVLVTWLAAQFHWTGFFPTQAPFVLQVVLALAVAEFAYYWVHRLGHTWQGLWQFHAVHHGSERVYSLNAGRFHLVDAWLSTLAYLGPLLLLGVPAEIVALIATLNAITGFMEHVNIDFEAGFLNRFFNTAQLHRWHHTADLSVAHCNFGKVLSIWDQVFGTYYLPQEAVGTVGIGSDETPVPSSILGQTLYPWKRQG